MRYSATTNGFYAEDVIYASVPEDCIEVSAEEYAALMNGQASGNEIIPDANGYPQLVPVA